MDGGTKQVVLFNLSGLIGTALFFGVYNFILSQFPDSQGLVWTLSYLLSIVWQHALHRAIVFGSSQPYFKSLISTYAAYSVGIVLSMVLMWVLERLQIDGTVSWFIGLIFTGVLNYFTVSAAFKKPASSDMV
eukprot:TRINITY_DN12753_c0_g1_i1.p1 TRINITY_DN12753_c0_g1~~TRINITY_DN12753_c0_g1_i1.p1  ORF type:complete len:144 (-),score=18.13 TRINITY_DN12753_c0_g1_i1:65-460(-)